MYIYIYIYIYIYTKRYTEDSGGEVKTGKVTVQKMQFSIQDVFSKYDQIHRKLRIWSHLLKKFLMKKFVFCAVNLKVLSTPNGKK